MCARIASGLIVCALAETATNARTASSFLIVTWSISNGWSRRNGRWDGLFARLVGAGEESLGVIVHGATAGNLGLVADACDRRAAHAQTTDGGIRFRVHLRRGVGVCGEVDQTREQQ